MRRTHKILPHTWKDSQAMETNEGVLANWVIGSLLKLDFSILRVIS